MPVVADPQETEHVKLTRSQLADLLGVKPDYISKCVHSMWYCKGEPLWEYAEWHPGGNQIQYYMVPKYRVKELADEDEWIRYDIFDADE